MKSEVLSIEPAYKRLLFRLEKDSYKVNFVEPINQGRYLIIKGFLNNEPHNLLVMYKREPFFSFGEMFKNLGARGSGDTINVDDLKLAIQKDVKEIFILFPNASAYSIQLIDFLTNCIHWTNREGKEVRSISLSKYKFEFKI